MYALTIQQPYASLIIEGKKQVETRSWHTHYRGPLAIHAGKVVDREALEMFSDLLSEPVETGCFLGTVFLAGCELCPELEGFEFPPIEYELGWWEDDRYGWVMMEPHRKWIEARGNQGLWVPKEHDAQTLDFYYKHTHGKSLEQRWGELSEPKVSPEEFERHYLGRWG